MATLEENINQAIADFDDIEKAIEEQGVDVPAGTDTKEYGNLIRSIPKGVDVDLFYNPESENAQSGIAVAEALAGLPIKYVVSPDANGNTVFLRSLESGTYVLNGAFKPYDGNNTVCRFSSDLLVNVVKGTLNKVPTSHIQIFYPVHNVVQFVDVTDSTYKRTDVKLNDLASMQTVEEMIAGAQNAYSNALKGKASGEVVRVDDVSPIEHKAKISVRGNNLFDVSKVQTTGGATKINITEVGTTYIVITSESGYNSNGFCATGLTLSQLCPQLREGDEVTLNAESNSNMKCFYLDTTEIADNVAKFWHFGNGRVVTKEMLNAIVCVYGLNAIQDGEVGVCTVSNIQIKDSNATTEYEPYIDPTAVTVTRCGKNLFDINNEAKGENLELGNGVVSANSQYNTSDYIYIPADTIFVGNFIRRCAFYDKGKNYVSDIGDNNATIERVLTMPQNACYVRFSYKTTSTDGSNVQIEVGTSATKYEPYGNYRTYTPAADGACEINSLSPTMTLLTDTEGANIEIEYNQDNNAFADNVKSDLRELDNVTADLIAKVGEFETALDTAIALCDSYIDGGTE